MADAGVLGVFREPRPAAAAIRALRERGFRVRAVMPAAYPEVLAALGKPRSPIDFFTLPGALLGIVLGVALTAGTSLAWPLVTGGKPIVSWPPFLIVTFEIAVLVGSLVNLAAVSVGTRLGDRPEAFPRGLAVGDAIGVLALGGDAAGAEQLLRAAGPQEVRRV